MNPADRPIEDLQAADEFRRSIVPRADYKDSNGAPLWHGWALMDSFLAGVDYVRSSSRIEWPRHEASLHLTHNEHKAYYQTVQQRIDDGDHGYEDDCWVSPEQRQKAIETNECWTLQWYPDTPVGFCILSAADLDVLVAAARSET